MLSLLQQLADKAKRFLRRATYYISKTATATVLVGGALCGITKSRGGIDGTKIAIAASVFVFGLPVGLIIFGPVQGFTLLWLGCVIGVLFLTNLNNVWEIVYSLKHGGLDYNMARNATAAVDGITPSREEVKELHQKIEKLGKKLSFNAINTESYGLLQ